jgi:hypothetical protein
MKRGRVQKQLDKLYRFTDDGIMSLGDYLNKYGVSRKTTEIRNHSRHKIQGSYKEIRDTRTYTLYQNDRMGIDVPKLVYDLFNAPEKIIDNRF